MNEKTEVLIKYRLDKAKETLESAEILLNGNKMFSSVNRIYYAMFYSVSALLLKKKLVSSKHSGVLAYFNREFVHKGIVSEKFGRFYSEMFRYRQKGDYEDFAEFNKEEVKDWLNKAKEFVSEIGKLLEERGNH